MGDRTFPLDAEQMVRLAGALAVEIANALRHPAADPIGADEITIRLGAAIGVPIPQGERWAGRRTVLRATGERP